MDCIMQNLFLGAMTDARGLLQHNPFGIAAILDCRMKLEQSYPIPPGIIYKLLGVEDAQPIPAKLFWTALDFINEHLDRPLLVHCAAGASRSPVIVASFLVSSGQAPDIPTALSRIQSIRPVVRPDATVLASVISLAHAA
jgi:rhodanese-related sulfurtransferase